MRNKLSRKGTKVPTPSLDESLDDFEPIVSRKSQRVTKSQPVKKQESTKSKTIASQKTASKDKSDIQDNILAPAGGFSLDLVP